MLCGVNSDFFSQISEEKEQFRCYRQDIADTMVGLGNCPPTPPLNQHFALREKYVKMVA